MFRLIYIAIVLFMTLVSCHEGVRNPNSELTDEAFAGMRTEGLRLNSHAIRRGIDSLMRADGVGFISDRKLRDYYSAHGSFIWITRNGVEQRADSALVFLRRAAECGIDTNMLRTNQICRDIKQIRLLDGFELKGHINKVMARLEYNLTRAYLRYAAGQMYGFVNPDKLYNNIEKCDSDTVSGRVIYSHLCDLRTVRADSMFFATAIRKAFNDSIGSFLSAVQPRGALYRELVGRLNTVSMSADERRKTLCNIERCRWRQRKYREFQSYDKYVVVNIPSCSLFANDGEETLTMRVAVGTNEHKTPLLTSAVKRMDINPQWIVPKSIAKGIAGRFDYMHSHGMFVVDKKLGKLAPEESSYRKIIDGEQYIVQAGGPKNSLGRIIFRFDNNFAVYLHDTSSPWLLQRSRRDISHGCVRVEKPLDLALFMLDDKEDETLPDKIKYSMSMPFINDADSVKKVDIDRKLIINNVHVKPVVPIFITYYTLFYTNGDGLVSYPDIYNYDEPLARELSSFMK